jgi:hypothetical protein
VRTYSISTANRPSPDPAMSAASGSR